MSRQVTMADDVAATAERLAAQQGLTLAELLAQAVWQLERTMPPARQSDVEATSGSALTALQALSARTSRLALPGARSSHDDLYDESGLPH